MTPPTPDTQCRVARRLAPTSIPVFPPLAADPNPTREGTDGPFRQSRAAHPGIGAP
jgi:hypothetical protein